MGVAKNWGYHIGDPHNKGYIILGSILGVPLSRETTISGDPRFDESLVADLRPLDARQGQDSEADCFALTRCSPHKVENR